MLKKKHHIAFTAHANLSNPGPGAWSSVIYESGDKNNKHRKRLNNFKDSATAQYLDLEAIVTTIESVSPRAKLSIIHDSAYIDKVLNKWIFIWEAKGYITSQNKPVNNLELVQKLSTLRKSHDVEFIYTKKSRNSVYTQTSQLLAKLFLLANIEKNPPELTYEHFKSTK